MSKTLKVIAIAAVLIGSACICLSFFEMPSGWWTTYGWALALVLCVLWPIIYIWSLIIFVKRENWMMVLFLIVVAILVLALCAPCATSLLRCSP